MNSFYIIDIWHIDAFVTLDMSEKNVFGELFDLSFSMSLLRSGTETKTITGRAVVEGFLFAFRLPKLLLLRRAMIEAVAGLVVSGM